MEDPQITEAMLDDARRFHARRDLRGLIGAAIVLVLFLGTFSLLFKYETRTDYPGVESFAATFISLAFFGVAVWIVFAVIKLSRLGLALWPHRATMYKHGMSAPAKITRFLRILIFTWKKLSQSAN